MKFDVVLGNPPYQNPKTKTYKLWIKFLEISKDLSNHHVLMVTPTLLWRATNHIQDLRSSLDSILYSV